MDSTWPRKPVERSGRAEFRFRAETAFNLSGSRQPHQASRGGPKPEALAAVQEYCEARPRQRRRSMTSHWNRPLLQM